MKVLTDFLKKVKTINASQLAFNIYKTTEFEFLVVSLITEGQPTSQLEKGIGADGQIIGVYSLATEAITGGRKKAGSPYNLKDSGFYYDSHEIRPFVGGFDIIADSDKPQGDFLDILGIDEENVQALTDGNLQIIIDELKELFPDEIRKFLRSIRSN